MHSSHLSPASQPTTHKISEPVLSTQQIKEIVHQALANKELASYKINQRVEIFQELMLKRKIRERNRLEKVRDEMKIFSQLENFIDFQHVYNEIRKRITERYNEKKRKINQQNLNPQPDPQLLFEQQVDLLKHTNENQIMKDINLRIQSEYGWKRKQMAKEESKYVASFIAGLEGMGSGQVRPNARLEDNWMMRKKKKFQSCNFNKAMFDQSNEERQNNPKRIRFELKNRLQIEYLLREGLTFLVLAIQNIKRTTNFATVNTKKIKILTDKKISLSSHNLSQRQTANSTTNASKLIRSPATSTRAGSHSASRRGQRQTSARPEGKKSTICYSLHEEEKRGREEGIGRMSDSSGGRKLKKIRQNRDFGNKLDRIIGEIEREQTMNRLNRPQIDNFFKQAAQQYCEIKKQDEMEVIIGQIQDLIVDRSRIKIHHRTRKNR